MEGWKNKKGCLKSVFSINLNLFQVLIKFDNQYDVILKQIQNDVLLTFQAAS